MVKFNQNQKTKKVYDKHAKYYDIENKIMERKFSPEREIFNALKGNILEVGVGTGSNLYHYDPSVNLTIVDFSSEMINIVKSQVKKFNLKYVKSIIEGDIENLDKLFEENSFDFVTSTCVFCSVPHPIRGLKKVRKVLKPEGFLVQIEHGLGNNTLINLFLKFFDPLTTQMRGFHIARDQISNIKAAGFKIIKYRNIDRTGIVKTIISQPK